ncbi:MAG: pyrroloquinoline quinone-dependent dehydrogenase [Myxococcota bacterium]
MKRGIIGLALGLLLGCGPSAPVDLSGPVADWPEYGGDKGGLRWSPLDQITPSNVGSLEIAWVHRHGDIAQPSEEASRTSFNATPLMVGDTLYFCTGKNRVFALAPETGEERWVFDPVQRNVKLDGPYPRTCRGVAHWADPRGSAGGACRERIFTGTVDGELIALDARSGQPCSGFGSNGRVDLHEGLGEIRPWEYYPTSPPIVVRDVVVIGALISDNLGVDAPAGVVRGYDARTGALRWAWDPVPPDPRTGASLPAFTRGTPNVWSILSADDERGLVFVPTGNAGPDYFSGQRRGLDHYASSTVALRAETGEVVWSVQFVHHDIWDYDTASQATLADLPLPEGPRAVVIQATKMGHVFVLDRDTGEPVFPVEERPVPPRDVRGETVTPTQPFPTHIPPLHPQTFSPEDAWGFTWWDRRACAQQVAGLRSEGIFTPPSLQGSLHFPGSAGGANWGSVSIDPRRGVMFVNTMRMPSVVRLIPRAEYEKLDPSEYGYPNEIYPMEGTPFGVHRAPLLSPLGAPCTRPPWGLMTAVDLVAGEILWESVLGSTRDQAPFPMWLEFGSPNLGGPITTAGGVVFIGATTDKFIRGYGAESGRLIWKHRLPFTANSTPLTYRVRRDGRQYLVIASGGHGWSEPGDATIAFALP